MDGRRIRIETVVLAAAGLIVAVVVIALLTGTADDLPWGAIILAAVVLAFGWVTARRRERAMRGLDDEG